MAAAAIPILSAGAGLLAAKLARPKQQPLPPPAALPAAPDRALEARHAMEAAQAAAGIQRARGQNNGRPSTLLTGPSGLPTPVPTVKKTALGQ